ncbi:MAG: hypothetical protein DYH20_07500 [Gammaproteobacteria bacterium PRO9]|nr:hypothetical protein [Gammaproteobacteria bacterium PRO9]
MFTQAPAPELEALPGDERLAKHSGFSSHVGAAAVDQRDNIELPSAVGLPPQNQSRWRDGLRHR